MKPTKAREVKLENKRVAVVYRGNKFIGLHFRRLLTPDQVEQVKKYVSKKGSTTPSTTKLKKNIMITNVGLSTEAAIALLESLNYWFQKEYIPSQSKEEQ